MFAWQFHLKQEGEGNLMFSHMAILVSMGWTT